jgi:hypothetical protein
VPRIVFRCCGALRQLESVFLNIYCRSTFATFDWREAAVPGSFKPASRAGVIARLKKKGTTIGALLSRLRQTFSDRPVPVDRSVTEEHAAVRRRTIALRRSGSVRCAGSGCKQGDRSDQGGKNAFHGAAPQRLVRDLVRSMD